MCRTRRSSDRGRHTARGHWIIWVATAAVESDQWSYSNVDGTFKSSTTGNKSVLRWYYVFFGRLT